MTEEFDCGCSVHEGPCETHADLIALRQGAAVRTGDELNLVFIDDCLTNFAGELLTEDERVQVGGLETALEAARDAHSGVAWFDAEDSEAAAELARLVEQRLPEGTWVNWEDGYVILQASGGPLTEPDES